MGQTKRNKLAGISKLGMTPLQDPKTGVGERVTLQYFPERSFVGITVPKSRLKNFVANLIGVKRVIFQMNTMESSILHGQVEIVFDDGTQSPFCTTVDVRDFGYPVFPFLSRRGRLLVAVMEKNVPKAVWMGLGESHIEILDGADGSSRTFCISGTRVI